MAQRPRAGSLLSGPDKPVIVACKENKDGLIMKMDTLLYVWIDVAGVKFIDSNSRVRNDFQNYLLYNI